MELSLKNKMKMLEGSKAVAETIKVCEPKVISAYPITPQTHIVEYLSQMVANGEIKAEYVNVESEHSAISVCLGASAAGARTYTATTSQGLLLMTEVLYNVSGLRLPIVLTCANRAISSPLNIWNDHQDSYSVRDSGWIQLYAEDNQEALDLHLQAYRIAEDERVSLPVMVCMDGFLLTHTYEPVELLDFELVKKFLPPFKPKYYLNVQNPLTLGSFAEPDKYFEFRYLNHKVLINSKKIIKEAAEEFKNTFGRFSGDLIESYYLEDAKIALVAMGSLVATLKEEVGVLKIRAHRPFPFEEIKTALKNAEKVIILEKAISLGLGSILETEIKNIFYKEEASPEIKGIIAGLGGRDIPKSSIYDLIYKIENNLPLPDFLDLKLELIENEGEE
ncbi:MAG: pyruvate ferredoxin oxidoreductase [Armatimonadetes bacterium]|nr:pyruvate ferredoxin oxidoreductase [Armatimonadota bacterium]